MTKKTPLHKQHVALGARMIDFSGWDMPLLYAGIIEEHKVVRRNAGIFDISHMGEFMVSGPQSTAFLNHALSNDVGKLTPGWGQYTLLLEDNGGVVDDLYLYQLAAQHYLMVVNASRIEADWARLQSLRETFPGGAKVDLRNAAEECGAVAIQGPQVADFIESCSAPAGDAGSFTGASVLIKNQLKVLECGGAQVVVARTGYTGEDGFEVVAPSEWIEEIWITALSVGAAHGLRPIGLGARDTLRTEVCYPLYGAELDHTTSPLEAGLGFAVDLNKGPFVGREALARQKREGLKRRCVAFRINQRSAPPRPGYPIWRPGPQPVRIGVVTSGGLSPSLEAGIGMAYVSSEFARPGSIIEIEIRGRKAPATVHRKPLYRAGPSN